MLWRRCNGYLLLVASFRLHSWYGTLLLLLASIVVLGSRGAPDRLPTLVEVNLNFFVRGLHPTLDQSNLNFTLIRAMSTSIRQDIKIAVLDDYHNVSPPIFASLPNVTIFRDTLPPYAHPSTSESARDALVDRLRPFAVICCMRERTPFPADLLKRLPNLQLLASTGMRNNSIDMVAAKELDIVVVGTASAGGSRTADAAKDGPEHTVQHTWALILALARGVARDDAGVKSGGWQSSFAVGLPGKVLGVVGLGRLGAAVGKIAVLAWGMKVVAWSSSLTQEQADEKALSCGLEKGAFQVVSKEELFRTADVVSVHYVLSPRSLSVVGAPELASMKPSALLINTSRGPLVDEEALLAVLVQGKIYGAALDVFDVEPLPVDSRWRTTNWGKKEGRSEVVLTPHMGYGEEETFKTWYKETAANVERWMKGEEVVNRIN